MGLVYRNSQPVGELLIYIPTGNLRQLKDLELMLGVWVLKILMDRC